MSENDNYPVSDQIDVLDGETIYKSDGWWKAVVLCESFGNKAVNVYLWRENDDDSWSRKQKYKVSDAQEWSETESAISELADEHL